MTHERNDHVIQTCFWMFLDPNTDEQVEALISTHSHEGDYFIHIRSDVALHKGHQHSQLLEQKLKGEEVSKLAPWRMQNSQAYLKTTTEPVSAPPNLLKVSYKESDLNLWWWRWRWLKTTVSGFTHQVNQLLHSRGFGAILPVLNHSVTYGFTTFI